MKRGESEGSRVSPSRICNPILTLYVPHPTLHLSHLVTIGGKLFANQGLVEKFGRYFL